MILIKKLGVLTLIHFVLMSALIIDLNIYSDMWSRMNYFFMITPVMLILTCFLLSYVLFNYNFFIKKAHRLTSLLMISLLVLMTVIMLVSTYS
jgi:hypothetical protein